MSKKHGHGGGGGHGDGGGHGGDRPWVYFMVDSFFLVTQFFVITFKQKVDEVVLPQRLPPGGTSASSKPVPGEQKQKLAIHVTQNKSPDGTSVASYEFMTRQVNLTGLHDMLGQSVTNGQQYQVRVSYDPDVSFGHVMAVFNACNKAKIAECGLVPLRGR